MTNEYTIKINNEPFSGIGAFCSPAQDVNKVGNAYRNYLIEKRFNPDLDLLENIVPYFDYQLTLTFKPELKDKLDCFQRFLKALKAKCLGIRYFFLPEYLKNGSVYFRGVISRDIEPYLEKLESVKSKAYNLSLYNYGYSVVVPVKKEEQTK